MITFYTDYPHLTEPFFFQMQGQFKVSDKEWDYPYQLNVKIHRQSEHA